MQPHLLLYSSLSKEILETFMNAAWKILGDETYSTITIIILSAGSAEPVYNHLNGTQVPFDLNSHNEVDTIYFE